MRVQGGRKKVTKKILSLLICVLLLGQTFTVSAEEAGLNEETIQEQTETTTVEEEEQPEEITSVETELENEIESETEDLAAEESETEQESEEEQIEVQSENTVYLLQYQLHCQSIGWQDWKKDGELAGTTGLSKRAEAISIKVKKETVDPKNPDKIVTEDVKGAIEYKTHCQTYGDGSWVQDGAVAGTTGEKKRMEAIQIRLKGELAEKYDIYYQVHCSKFGDMGWAKNGEWAGTSGYSRAIEAITILLREKGSTDVPQQTGRSYLSPTQKGTVTYSSHVQSYGWMDSVADGAMSGTQGQSKRMEALRIYLENPRDAAGNEITGSIEYQAHSQSYGWMGWKPEGEIAGTTGQAKRLEAIQIRLTGAMAEQYDVYYRVHASKWGTLGWAKNGEIAGTVGYYRSIESIEIKVVKKGSANSPAQNTRACLDVGNIGDCSFSASVMGEGWQGSVGNRKVIGTTGQGKAMDAFALKVGTGTTGNINSLYSGSIVYKAYMQGTEWQNAVSDGAEAGLSGKGKRVEAIQIRLTGELATYCDVYYRTHVQAYGWLGWAKNGQTAGTSKCSYRLEAVQIVIVPKTAPAPGDNANYYKDRKYIKSKYAIIDSSSASQDITMLNSSKGLGAMTLTRLSNAVNALRGRGYQVSFLAMDLETGEGVTCGAYDTYYSASTIKGPYVCALNYASPVQAVQWRSTMEQTITVSSNEGYASLRRGFGASPMSAYMTEAQVSYFSPDTWYPDFRPVDLAKLWVRNYEYFYSGQPNADWTRSIFNRSYNSFINEAMSYGTTTVYSKPGWAAFDFAVVQHDAGIVVKEGQHPYLVVVLSSAFGQKELLRDLVMAIDAAQNEIASH